MKYFFLLILTITQLLSSDAFIGTNKLKNSLNDKNLIILDVSKYPIYKLGHIEGAYHLNIFDFTNKSSKYPKLAKKDLLQEKISELGINKDSKVVIYSHNTKDGIVYSSYIAFVLLYCGFENVSILDGGYMAWIFNYELLTSSHIPKNRDKGNFLITINSNILVNKKYLYDNLSSIVMLDARSPQDYYGITRSKFISSIGHIPFAKSSYYKDKFLTDDTLRKQSELDEIYLYGFELKKEDEIIVYSDNIFSASMEFYILYKQMGYKKTKLYEASLVEWGNEPVLPIKRFKWE